MSEQVPADYKCFDCGYEIHGSKAGSASFVGQCPECKMGMMLVVTLDGKPVNRGYFRGERAPSS